MYYIYVGMSDVLQEYIFLDITITIGNLNALQYCFLSLNVISELPFHLFANMKNIQNKLW